MPSKPIQISAWWAGLLASLLSAGILGGIAYAVEANADLRVVQNDVKEIKDANLEHRLSTIDTRVARIEEQGKAAVETSERMEMQQRRIDDKIDKLLLEVRK